MKRAFRVLCIFVAAIFLFACGCSTPSDTYSVSGTISGSNVVGVTINLTGSATANTMTDASGNYIFNGLANGAYTVTPVLAYYIIEPISTEVVVSGASLTNINFSEEKGPMRLYYNPYGEVNWSQDFRLKAQHHDHAGINETYLKAYDTAGYDVVSLMTYSGVASLDYTATERYWPPEDWLSQSFLSSLKNIKFFISNGEEVGYDHITSPFLTTYIAKWEPEYYSKRESWHYSSTQECIDLIKHYGGMAFIAHPSDGYSDYADLTDYDGVEVYSAYVRYEGLNSTDKYWTDTDRNAVMVGVWDQMLLKNQFVHAIAVNDWYGPWNDDTSLDNSTRDSGKIVALAHEKTLESYRDAMERGAFFAVKDIGVTKNGYPDIRSISVDDNYITIDTDNIIFWVVNGVQVGQGKTFLYNPFSLKALYVRAEIINADGSTVYTQAFVLKPVEQ